MACGYLRRVFEVFEKHRTPVDVVTTSKISVSVTIDDDRRLTAVMEGVADFAEVQAERGMAILCLVGDGLRRDPRIAARMLGVLYGFPLRMVSQAASRRNVTVVLRDADVPGAMSRLHEMFFGAAGHERRAEGLAAASVPLLLVGHGRMGRLVEGLASEYGMHVAGVIRGVDAADPGSWPAADVAIDFSIAEAVPATLGHLAARGTDWQSERRGGRRPSRRCVRKRSAGELAWSRRRISR